jgi:hypothetical protein
LAAAIIPSAPVLVPELAGAAADEVADLRDAVLRAAAALPDRWVVVGVGETDARIEPAVAGSFAGFGVDVPVALSPATSPVEQLPLCALMAGWVRAQVRPGGLAQVRCHGDTDDDTALAIGRSLRAELDAAAEPIGVLIVADGCRTLTPSAPGGYQPEDIAVQQELDDGLARGDISALTGLPAAVVGRVAFGVLAGLAEPAPRSATELYRAAPYGVGYFAGVWQL